MKIVTEQTKQTEKSEVAKNELNDAQLDKVAGGSITRKVDASSPNLFQSCCAGAHIKTAT
jgi:type VI protein secretion system component Hcp